MVQDPLATSHITTNQPQFWGRSSSAEVKFGTMRDHKIPKIIVIMQSTVT
jgi:hypothetical protein